MTPRTTLRTSVGAVAVWLGSGCGFLVDFDLVGDSGTTSATSTGSGGQPTSTNTTSTQAGGDGGAGAGGSASGGAGGLGNGASCLVDGACASGHCVENVCCDTACDGGCEACDAVTGTVGECRPLSNGTICAGPTCSANVQTTGRCDGTSAACESIQTTCSNGCDGPVCEGNCVNDQSCGPTEYCFSATTCVPKKSNGTGCGGANECTSNHCVDGVCCDGACGGPCEACNVGGSPGVCSAVPNGTAAPADCPASAPAACGNNGSCNGSRGCAPFAASTSCAAATCSGAMRTPERFCNGSGACSAAAPTSCAPYQCSGAQCRTNCTVPADCVAPATCGGGGCGAPIGSACSAASECASGFCVDDACCDTACTGSCQACSSFKKGAGADGVCGSIVNADPDDECDGCDVCQSGSCGTACMGTQCCCVNLIGEDGICQASDLQCSGPCN